MKKMCVIMLLVLIAGSQCGCSGCGQQSAPAGKNDETIHISTTSSFPFLEEAAHQFERRNPGVKVEIDAYLTPESVKSNNPTEIMENYINNLNTELMSGKGADIIYVNALPYKKYISRHMFADLKQFMKSDPDFHEDEYYSNIWAAVEINNGLYTLPVEYGYELLGSKARINADDSLWNWEEFFGAAQNKLNGEGGYILSLSDEDLFCKIFRQNYSHFINEGKKTANFNSDEFINLLKQCKSLADKNLLAESSGEIPEEAGKQALFKYCDISTITSLTSSQTNLYRLPSDDKGSYPFVATMLAINNASPNKAAAWEFLKFVISQEMQASLSIGLPVNKSAFNEKCANESQQFCQDDSIKTPTNERIKLMQKYASFNESMVNDLKICLYTDDQIMKMVKTEAHSFFLGSTSARDAALIIQKKVSIYLEE